MIVGLRGRLVKKEQYSAVIAAGGFLYDVNLPLTVSQRLQPDAAGEVALIIYHYLHIEQSRGVPVMIGFLEELEKDFFEKFIGVSGIGPKAAVRAFEKPVPRIATAIEEGDVDFLTTLAGIGKQRAKQIVAHLQGKVGMFALIKQEEVAAETVKKEIVEEAKKVLRRLEYGAKEIDEMIKKATGQSQTIDTLEGLLNEIYRQRK